GVLVVFFVFFFQAEDGIRDATVTGVQTCALPIYQRWDHVVGVAAGVSLLESIFAGRFSTVSGEVRMPQQNRPVRAPVQPRVPPRSEERRVGKECRSRWWGYR